MRINFLNTNQMLKKKKKKKVIYISRGLDAFNYLSAHFRTVASLLLWG